MRRALIVLLLATFTAGCTQSGGGTNTRDFKGDDRDVADAISDFTSSASQKKESKACAESLSKSLNETVAQGGKSCASELGKAFDDADSSLIKIDDITITPAAGTDPATATAKVYVEDGDDKIPATWDLVDEDGDWRIDSFG